MNQKIVPQLFLASRKRRIAAFLIDYFVILIIIVSIFFLAFGKNIMDENSMGKMPIALLAVIISGFLLFFLKDSIKGISVGKWIMGIMVRDAKNPNIVPSIGRLFIRNLFILIWPVEFIILASSQENKRYGDKIANTIVVQNPNKTSRLSRILALAGIVIVFYIFTYLLTGSVIKNSDAYKVAVQEIEKNQEILDETGGIKGYGMIPSGSLNISNGMGQAQLKIDVLGNEKDMNISVYLTKEPNSDWQLINMNK